MKARTNIMQSLNAGDIPPGPRGTVVAGDISPGPRNLRSGSVVTMDIPPGPRAL